jgi:hypothetical protein
MENTDERSGVKCNPHPDAPHGFLRDASHNEGRYVCECEFWEEPKQQPVGYVSGFYGGYCVIQPTDPAVVLPVGTALYRAPREWVGLTEPELHEINPTWPAPGQHWDYEDVLAFVRAVEVKLKEKNHG